MTTNCLGLGGGNHRAGMTALNAIHHFNCDALLDSRTCLESVWLSQESETGGPKGVWPLRWAIDMTDR